MLRWFYLLLLCFGYCGETISSILVEGRRGGNATLKCDHEASETISYIRQGKKTLISKIPICQNQEYNHRAVCREEPCSIVLRNLSFTNAGKHTLRFSYESYLQFSVQVFDEMSVKKGSNSTLDILMPNADSVMHQHNTSTVWKVVWKRGQGVQRYHLNDSDGKLTINAFASSDAGKYRVVDSEEKILITVTITVSTESESKENLRYTAQDKLHDINNTHHHWGSFTPVGLCVLTVAVLILMAYKIKKEQ